MALASVNAWLEVPMPLTIQALVDRPDLGLRVAAGTDLRRPVRWVHVSELADPAPFLEGGELLLTTGLTLDGTAEECRAYVDRLVQVGIAGLGFGIGLRHDHTPPALVDAALAAELPLLVVPRPTPFIAISKAVAAALAREDQRVLSEALAAHRDLIRGALSPTGPREVAVRLARALHGWVLLLDQDGRARHGVPEAARRHATRIGMDLDRLRQGGPLTSAALTLAGESVTVLPLGVLGRVRGFLAVGRATPLTAVEGSVVTAAVALLSLELHNASGVRDAERRERRAVVRLAIGGHLDLALDVAEVVGLPFPEGRLRVAVLGVPPGYEAELLERVEHEHALALVCALVAEDEPGRLVVVLPVAEGDLRTLDGLLRAVPAARGAVSDPVDPADLPDAFRRARSVYDAATVTSGRLLLARDVTMAGLLAHLATADAAGWAESLLAPVTDSGSRLDLIGTLRVFLRHNGQVDPASVALGIHRHTLRYRLNKIAELLGRNLDDPTARAELWVALQIRALS